MKEHREAYRIADIQKSERPRERLARVGARALSEAELLAILLRSGVRGENAVQVGERLLREFEGLRGLQRATYDEVCAQHGIGAAKAAQIKAAIELGNRLAELVLDERPKINNPEDAAKIVKYDMSALEQEELRVILLNTRNQVLGVETIYKGSLNSSQVRVGELFKTAVRRNAASIIIVHNHPSGDTTPSSDDIALTRVVIEAGKLMDIEVLDHLIIAEGKHVSLKEKGLAFQ